MYISKMGRSFPLIDLNKNVTAQKMSCLIWAFSKIAERIGTKKTYISRLENGKAYVQLNTLFRIFEGLGRRVSLTIE